MGTPGHRPKGMSRSLVAAPSGSFLSRSKRTFSAVIRCPN
jgi:hypothetical protein